jgi:hypothetical protein
VFLLAAHNACFLGEYARQTVLTATEDQRCFVTRQTYAASRIT